MRHIQDHRISRRDFLRLSGTGLAAAGLGSLVGACGGGSQQELEMWWWGEQEAKGLKGWLEQSISMYRKKNGVNVTTNLQDTGDVIPGFQRASAANRAPDIQFFWNGGGGGCGEYCMGGGRFQSVEVRRGNLPASMELEALCTDAPGGCCRR